MLGDRAAAVRPCDDVSDVRDADVRNGVLPRMYARVELGVGCSGSSMGVRPRVCVVGRDAEPGRARGETADVPVA